MGRACATDSTGRAGGASDERGVFITFEGGDGSGKSTHVRFLSQFLEKHGVEVVCLREPGGTSIGEDLRQVVLSPRNTEMSPECELLVYEAARAQLVSQVIRPALLRGAVVICDRFYDSTVAYQGYARGLSQDFIALCNGFACQGVAPDRTILLVTGGSAQTGLDRATERFGADRLELEGVDFHTKVNEGFLQLQRQHPERIRMVHSSEDRAETARGVFEQLADLFPCVAEVLETPQYFDAINRKYAVL